MGWLHKICRHLDPTRSLAAKENRRAQCREAPRVAIFVTQIETLPMAGDVSIWDIPNTAVI